MIVELYKGFPVYACIQDEKDVELLRLMWENEYFDVIYVFTVFNPKEVEDVLAKIEKDCQERGIIAFLNEKRLITNMESVKKIMREKGYVERNYSSVRDIF